MQTPDDVFAVLDFHSPYIENIKEEMIAHILSRDQIKTMS
jgi:hypothetical protein